MPLIEDAHAFLRRLDADNNRDWFMAHKAEYDAKLKAPAQDLLEKLAEPLGEMTDAPIGTKLFRPHRDVRFSTDKTPYKTHLHMLWTVEAGARQDPALFFGIGLDDVTVGTGIPEFTKDVLADWRRMVDLDGDRIAGVVAAVEAKGYGLSEWGPPVLKRVPPPFPQDHPHGDLLRRKGLTMAGELAGGGDVEDRVLAAFRDLWPVSDMLLGVAEASALS